MAFEMEMPESTDRGGSFLDQPGTYHFSVTAVDEQPSGNDGKLIDGFRVSCAVLAGTTNGQEKKEVDITFFNPKLSDVDTMNSMSTTTKKQRKNNGELAKKKQARFVLAVGLLDGPRKGGERVTIDLQQAIGRQFLATMEERTFTKRDGSQGKSIDLHFADLWHVDDPEAAAYPKNDAALKLLPASLRKKPEQFGSSNGNGSKPVTNGTTTKPAAPAAAPAAAVAPAGGGVSIDDL